MTATEQCDDGNTRPGDCCSPQCRFESSSTVCRAASDPCDLAERCTGQSAACPSNQRRAEQAPCDDGDPCTVGERCLADICTRVSVVSMCTNSDGCCARGCTLSQGSKQDTDCKQVVAGDERQPNPAPSPGPVDSKDLDGDGDADLVEGDGGSEAVFVCEGDGNGNLECPGAKGGPVARSGSGAGGGSRFVDLALADVNGDGRIDVVAALVGANPDGGELAVRLGDGALGFSPGPRSPVGGRPVRVEIVELTADDRLDVVLATGNGLEIQRNRGDGSFERIALREAGNLVADVSVGRMGGVAAALPDQDRVRVYALRAGTVQEIAAVAVQGAQAVALGDFTGDGLEDMAVASREGFVALHAALPAGGFEPKARMTVEVSADRLERTDVNGDGLADLVALDQATGAVQFLFGAGAGSFEVVAGPAAGTAVSGLAVSDLNGDRVPDLVLSGADLVVGVQTLGGGPIVAGDATGDGEVDEPDLDRLIAELFDGDGTDPLGCGELPVACAAGADVNGDGRLGAADLTGIRAAERP